MDDHIYKDLILEHWQNPQNFGVIKNADIDTELDNPFCGDKIRLTIKMNKNRIQKIAFSGTGCAISIASASIFTEKIKNKSLKDIKKITPDDLLEELQIPLTLTRTKCALLIFSTLKQGLSSL